jgi:hypothetical protein
VATPSAWRHLGLPVPAGTVGGGSHAAGTSPQMPDLFSLEP